MKKVKRGYNNLQKLASIALIIVMTFGMTITISAKETQDYLDELETLKDLIMETYSGSDVTEEELFEAAFSGMTSILDKYSVFYNATDAQTFLDALSSEYVGIGVRLELRNEQPVITEVFEGGAAYDGNVQVNDVISKVNGEPASDYELNALVDKIVGEEGTFVTIEFKRGGLVYELELERRKVIVPTVIPLELDTETYNLTDTQSKQIAAYKVTSFADLTDEMLNDELTKAKAAGTKYLLLDMRGNGGGYLDTAVNMLSELIPTGTIVTLKSKTGETTVHESVLPTAPFKVVLVVDENSASATEIFAAAIKDSKVGVVIGEQTYGKGVAQNIYRLGTDYLVKLTTQEFFSPNGYKINGIGVTPDIIIDNPEYIYSSRRLFVTDEDEQVKNAEGILAYLGYFNEEPDAIYTNSTYKAVWAFQEATGLYPYGVCDYTTQARLNTEYRLALEKNDIQLQDAVKWIVEDTQK